MNGKTIEVVVYDGDDKLECTLKRPDMPTMSRVNKLAKQDEMLAMQEMLKGCWVKGDEQIKNDPFLVTAVSKEMKVLWSGVKAELKNS